MEHRTFFFLIALLLPLSLFAQKDPSAVKERALELFEDDKPDIEKSQDMEVKYQKVHLGHLNDDKGLDAVVEFGLGPKKGNKAVKRQIAVYMQQAAGLRPVDGIEPDFCPEVVRITDHGLLVNDIGSCLQPSDEGTVRYVWNGEEMELDEE